MSADLIAGGELAGQTRTVRLRTLVVIRWAAIAGQAVTALTVHYGLNFLVPIGPVLGVIGLSVLFNLLLVFRRPMNSRISAFEASLQLAYDILQLAMLLYLTGGLKNPFALLLLAPVTVSATALPRGATVGLGLLASATITLLSIVHLPFPSLGQALVFPDFYMLGLWEALILGTVFIAGYVGSVSEEARRMSTALNAAQMALAREQELSAVGALAAAAAHQLGSPLGTIAVTAREMAREVPPDSELRGDVDLLIEQSERCRAILAELGQPLARDDLSPLAKLPIGVLVETAGAPYRREGITVEFLAGASDTGLREDEPQVPRRSDVIHALGTLIQNAVEFASKRVIVRTTWAADRIRVEIADDGEGFPRSVLERVGEPYISTRSGEDGHMGLGIFIAQTLLERTGGMVTCRNRPDGGAMVSVGWPRGSFEGIMSRG